MELTETLRFDIDAVSQRLMEELYSLLAALPMLLLALLVIWVGWALGGWLSRRALLERVAQRRLRAGPRGGLGRLGRAGAARHTGVAVGRLGQPRPGSRLRSRCARAGRGIHRRRRGDRAP